MSNSIYSGSPSTRLASFLIAHLSPESYGSYNSESLSGHFVVHIPSQIGHNAGLIAYSDPMGLIKRRIGGFGNALTNYTQIWICLPSNISR